MVKNNNYNMSKPKRQFQNADIYQRINYLYQAAHESLRTNRNDPSLCRFYVYNLKTIARRHVLHLHPEMKRTMCKRCCVLLIPALTCRLRIRNKRQKHTVVTCLECGMIRRYIHDPSRPPPWIDTMGAWEDKVVNGECVAQADHAQKKQKTQQHKQQNTKNSATVIASKTGPVDTETGQDDSMVNVAERRSEMSHAETNVVEHESEELNEVREDKDKVSKHLYLEKAKVISV